jgi:hypothetical protein
MKIGIPWTDKDAWSATEGRTFGRDLKTGATLSWRPVGVAGNTGTGIGSYLKYYQHIKFFFIVFTVTHS